MYAMIDDGELDWKIIAIATSDPLADKLNDVEDVERCATCCRTASGPSAEQGCRNRVIMHSRDATNETQGVPSSLPVDLVGDCGKDALTLGLLRLHFQRTLHSLTASSVIIAVVIGVSVEGQPCVLHKPSQYVARQPHRPNHNHRQYKSDLMRRRAALRQCTSCRTATARRETDRPGRHLRPASL